MNNELYEAKSKADDGQITEPKPDSIQTITLSLSCKSHSITEIEPG